MTPVIELLKTYDKQFREFTITGTKTDKDDNLVSVRESPYWRLLKGKETPDSDVSDVLANRSLLNKIFYTLHSLESCNSQTEDDQKEDGQKKVEITTQSFYGPQSASAQRYTTSFEGYHSCPKCDLMKRNRDRATLRIHLFQHYQSVIHIKLV